MKAKQLISAFMERWPVGYRLFNTLRGVRLHSAQVNGVTFEMASAGYGGWPLPHLAQGGIAYCFGVGRNTVFERKLAKLRGWEIHLFDPSPASLLIAKDLKTSSEVEIYPYGLSEIGGPISFTDLQDRSITSIVENYTGPLIALDTRTLPTIMSELGHHRVDLLKMTIEGREYAVIEALRSQDIRPQYIFVEFHHKIYGLTKTQTRTAVLQLASMGYQSFWVSDHGRQYAFIHTASQAA